MQQTIWKRGLALILALMLTVSTVPTAAWAQEDVTEPTETLETVPAPTESQPAPTGEETIPAESTAPAETIPAESTVPEESTVPAETVAEETEPTLPESVQAVQARIDALPAVDTVTAADYDAVQDAYDAYDALADEEKALIQGAEVFEALFAWFNAQTATLEAVASGTCGEGLTWILDDTGTLTISGTGAMANYEYYGSGQAPWYANRNSITAAVIEDGVTSIGKYAFYNCTKLESITIADSVTSIGRSAFENCAKLANVTIPAGVTRIDDWAFYDCDALTNVTIPGSVTRIGSEAFYGCAKLASVTFTEGLTTIDSRAFQSCTSLESITIPASVTSIGTGAFQSCSSLKSITIPEGVTSIGDSAFYNCSSLKSITIPEGVTSIGGYAFEYCASLESITIPASVTSIGSGAFSDCDSLKTLEFRGNAPSLDSNTFGSITATILYPSGNDTWAAAASGSYSASLTWKAVGTATEISVQTAPRRTMYQQGETEADLTGLVLLAADATGTTWEVLPGDGVTATMDTSSTGWTEVTLTWRGLTATYQIAVHSQGGRTLQPAADYPQASYYDEDGPEIRRSWTYSVPGADELVLTFTGDTHMEDWCDYLTLYDGTGA